MVSGRDLVLFTQHLYYLTGTGAPMPDILRNIRWDVQNRELKQAVGTMEEKTRRGESFSSALRSYPHIFPEYYSEMVSAAESTESLPQALDELAGYLEDAERTKKKAKAASLYPTLVLNFIFLVVLAMYIFVFPVMKNALSGHYGNVNPSVLSRTPPVSDFIFSPLFLAFLFVSVVFIDIIMFTNSCPGNSLLFNIPLIGRLIRKAYLVRIARSMGFMLQGGMTVVSALEQTAKTIDILAIRNILHRIREDVAKGNSLSIAMEKEMFFAGTFLSLVKAGENNEKLPLEMLEIANNFERQLEWETMGTLNAVEPTLILIVGALTGLIAAALFYPIYMVPSNVI